MKDFWEKVNWNKMHEMSENEPEVIGVFNMGLEVKIKKVLPNAQLPVQATTGAAAYDVFAATETIRNEKTGPIVEYDTGIAVEIPPGYYIDARPRSGITTKTTLMLGNGAGIIDSDYRGTIKFQFRQINPVFGVKYKVGDRIGQLIFKKYENVKFVEVEELSETERGQGGMGSTGD